MTKEEARAPIRKANKSNIAILVKWRIAMAVLLSAILYATAHANGYKLGVKNTIMYYEFVGEAPSEDWISESEQYRLKEPDDVEPTLDQYQPVNYEETK